MIFTAIYTPLSVGRDEYFAWGLHRIAKAVSFLNNDCKLVSICTIDCEVTRFCILLYFNFELFFLLLQVHGNVCMSSVVVTETLDWKLHAFDVLSEFDGNSEASTGPMLVYEKLE